MSVLSNLALNEPSGAQLNESSPDILSVPEACRLLSVHRNTLYKLIRAGELPAFRLITGGHWRFRRTDLAEWLETRGEFAYENITDRYPRTFGLTLC
jgi:excisionase family DNA binding protein